MPLHWGVMDKRGKVLVEPKHDKVEITPDGKAVITSSQASKPSSISSRHVGLSAKIAQ